MEDVTGLVRLIQNGAVEIHDRVFPPSRHAPNHVYPRLAMPITIRPAVASDEAALGRYGGALMRLHHQLDPQRFITTEQPEQGYGRFLVSQLSDPESVVLVAEREGQVVGYAFAALEPMSWKELRAACGFLHDVYVDPAARHAGVGRRLVEEAIRWLGSHGAPRVVLGSASANDAAQRLFTQLGFRHTMIEMTLDLDA